MEIIIKFEEFKSSLYKQIEDGNAIKKRNPSTNEEWENIINDKNRWVVSVVSILTDSFKGDDKDFFADSFIENRQYNFGGVDFKQEVDNLKNDIIEKIKNLEYYIKLLSISDSIINSSIVIHEKRINYTIKQKKELLLKKLKELNDGRLYDISYILKYNGIRSSNHNEPRELVNLLEEDGYVKRGGSATGVSASIKVLGIEYLENLEEEKVKSNYSTKEDIDDIHQRFDEVIEWLKTNNFGEEVIFDELQEIKDLKSDLDLKNWKQLLKMKLFELVVNTSTKFGGEAAKEVYKKITGEGIEKFLGV